MKSNLIITYKCDLSDLSKFQFLSNCLSQISSQVVESIALCYASVLDLATTLCFLLFQEIKLSPMETQ